MPSEIRFSDFRARFERFGVVFSHGGKHWKLTREDGGQTLTYPIPTCRGGRHVLNLYEAKARKALRLDSKHGVSDKEFYG